MWINKVFSKISIFISHIRLFFKNVYRFKKELWEFQDFDYMYNTNLFIKSLEFTRNYIRDYSLEVDKTRLVKVNNMTRLIEIYRLLDEFKAWDIAEKELNYKYSGYLFNRTEDQKETDRIFLNRVNDIEVSLRQEAKDILTGESGLQTWWD